MPQIQQLKNLTTRQYFITLLPFHLIQHKVLTQVTLLSITHKLPLLSMDTRASQSYCTSVQHSTCSRGSDSLYHCLSEKSEQLLDVVWALQPSRSLQVHLLSQYASQPASSPRCSATSSPARQRQTYCIPAS